MSKNTNRKGLALGAMFSLVASLFVGATPASANVTNAFTITPAGANSSAFGTFVDDDFTVLITRNVSVVSAADFAGSSLKVSITTDRTWGSTFSVVVLADTSSGTAALSVATDQFMPGQQIFVTRDGLSAAALSTSSVMNTSISGTAPAAFATESSPWASTTAFVVDPLEGTNATQLKVGLRLGGVLGTFSPSVVVNVRPFLDLNGNNIYDAASEPSAVQAVTFYRYSAVAPSVTFSAPEPGTSNVTASAVMSSLLNMDQIPGKFAIRFTQFQGHQANAVSYSAAAEKTVRNSTGNSLSDAVTLLQPASSSNTLSAQVVYISTSATVLGQLLATTDEDLPTTMWPLSTVTPAATDVTAQTLYAVKSSNALANGHIRANSLVTVRYSASAVAGAAVPVTFTFDDNVTLSSTKTISVDGGTPKTSGTASAVTKNVALTTGVAEITLLTTDFVAGDTITVSADAVGLAPISITLTVVALTYTLTADSSVLSTTPGGSVTVGVDVEDQFGAASTATNQRVRFRWAAGYGGSATTSDVAVVSGRASATMVHSPATSTLSAKINAALQDTVAGSNIWTTIVADALITDVIPTNAANGFRTGLAKSYSATISYGADFSWSPVINDAYVIVTGSAVVVSGTGLIFKDDVLGLTASDRITLPGDANARVKFYVTARKAGTYTVTLTAGTATTTSLIVVSDAFDNAGKSMAFDVSSMESGRAAIVTGTLTDLNGNPVDTPSGRINLTVTGTGATYVGSLTTETDANGRFQVALLSGTNQTGTMTITAVYYPTANAVAADRVTKVHTVSVVTPTAPEVNAVIGSFNGRWAVRVENAKGSVVSVKAGNRWVKFSALNNNYLFSRKSVVGRTIAVSVWVDGELQNSQTITIK